MYDSDINCCFDRGSERFRYRVGAIIIEDGCVLLATNDTADYYYSIGGGVHMGEQSTDAVIREVREETGVDYEIDRLAFVHENFFVGQNGSIKDIKYHELSLYYLMKSRGTQELDPHSYCEDGKEYVEWVPIDKLKNIKVFPDFYKEKLACIPPFAQRLVTK